LNSGGVSPRVPLYSAYSRVRNDARDIERDREWVGFCCWSRRSSIEMKPWIALVCWPSRVVKLSIGSA
jgi:hypothetical protein